MTVIFGPEDDAVPPATDAIASGVALALGGAGYVTVGPLPASASADGSPLRPSIPEPGMLRQPVMTRADAAHPATKMNVRFVFLFSILPTFDTSTP